MCAGAIYWSGSRRIVYGCSAAQLEEQVSGPGGFYIPIETLFGLFDAARDKMSVAWDRSYSTNRSSCTETWVLGIRRRHQVCRIAKGCRARHCG